MPLSVIVLAAGKGTRMNSRKPKVIHQLAGKPMLQHVVDTSSQLNPDQIIVVIGHESEQVISALDGQQIIWVEQKEQLGTGHAVMQCSEKLRPGNDILVLYGDVPLITPETLLSLVSGQDEQPIVSILSFMAKDPTGYGRILRDSDQSVKAIVEQKDASEEVQRIRESNSGIVYINGAEYAGLLKQIDNDNAQKEYYLTDVVKHAVAQNLLVDAVICEDEKQLLGVNNQQQLAEIEAIYRHRKSSELMLNGVKIIDPDRIDIRGNVKTARDVTIDINCILEGEVDLGEGVVIGANCVLKNCRIGDGSEILPMSIIEDSVIGENNIIGPFARIRPDTQTLANAKIGNFVEVKKSVIGKGSKVNHLSYVGDTEMGSNVNVGAGTITCNYDGAFKHKTIIEDDVFIGSDTQLVAPVKVTRGTTIGAGSTITKDTPENQLTFSRVKQISIANWVRPRKKV